MHIKLLILCNLMMVMLAGADRKAIAGTVRSTPQWSEPIETQPNLTPQWSEPIETNSQNIPQWSEPVETNSQNIPQWHERTSSPPPKPPSTQEPNVVPGCGKKEASSKALGAGLEVIFEEKIFSLAQNPPTHLKRYNQGTGKREDERNLKKRETGGDSKLGGVNSIFRGELRAETTNEIAQTITPEELKPVTPLHHQQFQLPTAATLEKGQVIFNFGSRLFFLPNTVATDNDTAAYPHIGFSWGITNNLELTIDAQRADTSSPGRQGEFIAERSPEETNFFLSEFQELSFDLKQKIWQNAAADLMLSGIVSLSFGSRGYSFAKNGVIVDQGEENGIVPALQIPLTSRIGERWQFTISPIIAFFSEENALQLHRPPTDNPGSFGTTFGIAGGVSVKLNPRLILWGDAFIPMTGNNSISRSSGKPDQAIAYNAGFRYLVNPQIGLDIFASNTLGSTGPLALTADRDFTAFAANLVFFPDFIGANRSLANSFDQSEEPQVLTTDGLGFFDGGTLRSGKFLVNLQSGSQGLLTAFRYGIVRDLELGIYLDYLWDDVDESEQGFLAKLQLLNQANGAPFTASLAATIGLTNEPFVNYINDDRNQFNQQNLDKSIPFFFQGDNKAQGQLFIATFSLPLHYQFNNGTALWFTPTLGYVQREGTEIAGINLGGSLPVGDFSLVGEVGANFTGDGNAFIGNSRENVIPWTFALRWGKDNFSPHLELYLTNRVGGSPWHQLRVRDQNTTAVGVGVSIPF